MKTFNWLYGGLLLFFAFLGEQVWQKLNDESFTGFGFGVYALFVALYLLRAIAVFNLYAATGSTAKFSFAEGVLAVSNMLVALFFLFTGIHLSVGDLQGVALIISSIILLFLLELSLAGLPFVKGMRPILPSVFNPFICNLFVTVYVAIITIWFVDMLFVDMFLGHKAAATEEYIAQVFTLFILWLPVVSTKLVLALRYKEQRKKQRSLLIETGIGFLEMLAYFVLTRILW